MAFVDLVSCAPFRLPAPRPLTPYEWNIVGTTFARSMPFAAASSLTSLIQTQPCAEWKTSAFGPAPAVSTYYYNALGRWFASLDPASKARATADIAGGLLCSGQTPWKAFADGSPTWEGETQNPGGVASSAVQGLERCAAERQRCFYTPMTGADFIAFAKLVMISPPPGMPPLPPVVQQMIQSNLPEEFLKRTFLLGFETALPGEPLKILIFSEVALIWAPGQGASVASIFRADGTIDIAVVMAVLAALAPSLAQTMLPGMIKNLPNLLPGLLGQVGTLPQTLPQALPAMSQNLPGLLTAATQVMGTVLGQPTGQGQPSPYPVPVLPGPLFGLGADAPLANAQPQTPARTGVSIVDDVPGAVASMSDNVKIVLAVVGGVVLITAMALLVRSRD